MNCVSITDKQIMIDLFCFSILTSETNTQGQYFWKMEDRSITFIHNLSDQHIPQIFQKYNFFIINQNISFQKMHQTNNSNASKKNFGTQEFNKVFYTVVQDKIEFQTSMTNEQYDYPINTQFQFFNKSDEKLKSQFTTPYPVEQKNFLDDIEDTKSETCYQQNSIIFDAEIQETNAPLKISSKNQATNRADNNFPILFYGRLKKYFNSLRKTSTIEQSYLQQFHKIVGRSTNALKGKRPDRYLNKKKLNQLFGSPSLNPYIDQFVQHHFGLYLASSKSEFKNYYYQRYFPKLLESIKFKKWI